MSLWRLIFTNLRRHRVRTGIGAAGIALGVATMLCVVGLLGGAVKMFERILRSDSEVVVFEKNVSDLFFSNVPVDFAGVPLIRTLRVTLSPSAVSMPVPIATSPSMPSTAAKMAKPPDAPTRLTSVSTARRKPRPGERKETASRRLVLPAPFSPVSTTCLPSRVSDTSA